MLTTSLLLRSTGAAPPTRANYEHSTRLLLALQPAPHLRFDGYADEQTSGRVDPALGDAPCFAHRPGVNALAIERFEGRYMISGGADGGIKMWDLEVAEAEALGVQSREISHKPLGTVAKTASHSFGISGLSFYPFDSLAFLSSSYDHTLKLYDSNTLACSASFDLTSNVYSHALSPIAQHLLVACATQHPTVRLVDLRSGAATHSLAGHGGGAVLTVAWSPKDEHILTSGGVDGSIRLWDVRRSAGTLGLLDMEDSIGVTGGGPARRRTGARAHLGPVNGVVWTDNGQFLVSTGHDERMRVWNMRTGANTLSNFGPIVRNKNLSTLLPLVVPRALVPAGQEMLFYPNEREILMCEIFEGTLLKRLRVPGVPASSSSSSTDQSNANARNRITSLAWRTHSVELLSAHADGMIRSWKPRTTIDALVEDAEREEDGDSEEEDDHKRKRKVLDDIHRDLTKRRITYS